MPNWYGELWWQETGSPIPVGCQCTSGDGGKKSWTRSDDPDVWVHVACGQPSLNVIRSQDMLNLIQGGEHHNELIETSDLTTKPEYSWIASYRWTPEIIVGSVSGRPARVWRPKEAASS